MYLESIVQIGLEPPPVIQVYLHVIPIILKRGERIDERRKQESRIKLEGTSAIKI
jgi:hypothetical protein